MSQRSRGKGDRVRRVASTLRSAAAEGDERDKATSWRRVGCGEGSSLSGRDYLGESTSPRRRGGDELVSPTRFRRRLTENRLGTYFGRGAMLPDRWGCSQRVFGQAAPRHLRARPRLGTDIAGEGKQPVANILSAHDVPPSLGRPDVASINRESQSPGGQFLRRPPLAGKKTKKNNEGREQVGCGGKGVM